MELSSSNIGMDKIDLQKLRFTADDALRMADENGGKTARLADQNKCEMDLVLYGDSQWGWYIFHDDEGSFIFDTHINPYTGNIYKWISVRPPVKRPR